MDRRCCCAGGCPIFEDDFNRANSTNIGSGWEEAWGDSEIKSNTLWLPSSGLVIGTKQHPSGAAELGHTGEVYGTAKNLQPGKKFQLCINAWEHPTSGWLFLYGMLECAADNVMTISVSGGHSKISNYTPGEDSRLRLCRTEGGLYFQSDLLSFVVWGCHEDNGGRKAGLANPGEIPVEFDDYYFGETWWTNPVCPLCECECRGEDKHSCVPKTLAATFDATGDCDCIDGESVSLEWDEDRPGDWVWNGQATLPEWRCEGGDATYEFDLYCASTPDEWMLVQKQGLSDCNGGWTFDGVFYYAYPSSYTCDPFCLTFGPFSCDWSCEPDGCECSYYVVVTP